MDDRKLFFFPSIISLHQTKWKRWKKYANFHLSSPFCLLFFSFPSSEFQWIFTDKEKNFVSNFNFHSSSSTKMHVSVVYSYFVSEEFEEFPVPKYKIPGMKRSIRLLLNGAGGLLSIQTSTSTPVRRREKP